MLPCLRRNGFVHGAELKTHLSNSSVNKVPTSSQTASLVFLASHISDYSFETSDIVKRMGIFKPIKIIDPLTGEERSITPEEQEEMLEKGIFLDVQIQSDENPKGVSKGNS
jgi:hypothetical protein